MSKYTQVNNKECLAEWQSLNKQFNEAAEKGDKKRITALKEKAMNNRLLTGRQAESISQRCDNALSGTYGKTKTTAQSNGDKIQ